MERASVRNPCGWPHISHGVCRGYARKIIPVARSNCCERKEQCKQ